MSLTVDQLHSAITSGVIPHVHEYFGVWAIEEGRFAAMVEQVRSMDFAAHFAARSGDLPTLQREFQVIGDVAVIDLSGTLMKAESSAQRSTSTVAARRQVRAAANDPEVGSILLRIDSPGGTVSGTGDLAGDVAAAAAKKPTLAFIEDLGASAAYWIASQASQVMANPTALVGSIGTFSVVEDWSARAAMAGLKVHVVRAGQFKGAGVPGTDVTADQLAEIQRTVDGLNEHFLAGVAAGRNLPPATVRGLADGRIHLAADAKSLGLVDAVGTFDQALAMLQAGGKPTSRKGKAMSTADAPAAVAARPASLNELEAACRGADSDFVLSQLRANATVEQAKDAWIARQNDLIVASQKAAADAKAAAAKPGVEPVGTGNVTKADAATVDAAAAWDELVAKELAKGLPRAKAVANVVARHPDLHRAYVHGANANRPEPLATTRGF